jgi:hypothetical protein
MKWLTKAVSELKNKLDNYHKETHPADRIDDYRLHSWLMYRGYRCERFNELGRRYQSKHPHEAWLTYTDAVIEALGTTIKEDLAKAEDKTDDHK